MSEDEEKIPSISAYERHVIFCTGPRCAPEVSEEVYQFLKAELRRLQVDQRSIRRSQTRCFGVCQGGPLMVVYPEGTWYHHLTKQKVKRIIKQHLLEGRPVLEWQFHNHLEASDECK